MKKLQIALTGLVLASATTCVLAADEMNMRNMPMSAEHMKAMDTNNDGMISRDEWDKHHETMWMNMPKNATGMVDTKTAAMPHGDGMKSDGMKSDGMKATPTPAPKDKPKSGY